MKLLAVIMLVLFVFAASAAPRHHQRRKRARAHKPAIVFNKYDVLTEHDAIILAKLPTDFPTIRPSSLRPISQFPTPRPISSKPTASPTQFPTKRPTATPTLKKSKKPTLAPSVKPSKQPSAFPTLKPTTAFPTKLRTAQPTWEEGYSTILTKQPSVKRVDSAEDPLPAGPTYIPTAAPTTGYPTQSPVQCSHLQSVSECSTKKSICEWYSVTTTNYLQFPAETSTYEYGCQERATFCEFTQGSLLDQQMACNQKNFPCSWSRAKNLCIASSRAPTPPPMPHEECYNICLAFADNGRCDDGGPGSHTNLCMLGTDCGDCGPRWIT